ncbi:unnamed protein product [Fusarium graminearum]|nr:unnamed protein product [Fusarium graminearum]
MNSITRVRQHGRKQCNRLQRFYFPRHQHLHTVPLIINGKDVITDETFPVIGCLAGKEISRCSSVSDQNVLDAIHAAKTAFPSWSATKPSERRDIFLRAAYIFAKRKEELSGYIREEIGASKEYQEFIIGLAMEGLRDTAGRISGAVTGQVPVSIHPDTSALVLKRPYGVFLGIAPWNAPYHLGPRSITFPLATGNLMIRPSDAAMVTDQLIAHPDIKKINFTGSSKVGSIISAIAGKHLKPVLMELGGKASALVLKDADLDNAAVQCTLGVFLNAGQICMSTERILVHLSIADVFKTKLQTMIKAMFGSPETMSLVNDTDYGLSATIDTKDLNKAFSLAEKINSGAVHINSMSAHDEFALLHGGVKSSGFGRFNGYQGVDEFL